MWWQRISRRSGLLLRRDCQQDHITADLATGKRQLLAIARPGKVKDQIRFEVGELFGFAAGQRHRPKIGYAPLVHYIGQRLPVGREAQSSYASNVAFESVERRSTIAGNHDPQIAEIRNRSLDTPKCDHLSVG